MSFNVWLVARGYIHICRLDYLDTFAPVAKLISLQIILANAVTEDLELYQMDIVAAFLTWDLDVEIHMEQPEGFIFGIDKDGLIYLLGKGLYGLKQSTWAWNHKIQGML